MLPLARGALVDDINATKIAQLNAGQSGTAIGDTRAR